MKQCIFFVSLFGVSIKFQNPAVRPPESCCENPSPSWEEAKGRGIAKEKNLICYRGIRWDKMIKMHIHHLQK